MIQRIIGTTQRPPSRPTTSLSGRRHQVMNSGASGSQGADPRSWEETSGVAGHERRQQAKDRARLDKAGRDQEASYRAQEEKREAERVATARSYEAAQGRLVQERLGDHNLGIVSSADIKGIPQETLDAASRAGYQGAVYRANEIRKQ